MDKLSVNLSDPLQGFDIRLPGLGFSVEKIYFDFSKGAFVINAALFPGMDLSERKVSFDFGYVDGHGTPFIKMFSVTALMTLSVIAVEAGKTVASCQFIGSDMSIEI